MTARSTATAPKQDTTNHTPVRKFRCPDPVWDPAVEQSRSEGMDMSELLRDLLRDYNAGKRMRDVRARKA